MHCANYDVTAQALTYVHSIVESQGTYPHRLTVSGKDYELALAKPNYQYRKIPFDSKLFDAKIKAHNETATAAETAKQNELNDVINRIEYVRVDPVRIHGENLPYVYEAGTSKVDMSSSSSGHSSSRFYDYTLVGYGKKIYFVSATPTPTFDPFTWP